MSNKTIQIIFFSVCVALVSLLMFLILKPFWEVIFISSVLVIVFYPLYKNLILKFGGRYRLAALVSTGLIFALIIVPVAILSALLFKEAVGLYNFLAFGGGSFDFLAVLESLFTKVNSLLLGDAINLQVDLDSYVNKVLNWIIGRFDSIFAAVFGGVLNFILTLISIYYLFVFGEKIKDRLVFWSPLPDREDKEFIKTLGMSIDAVLRGRILVSAAQGLFVGIGFAAFGVGSPVLWGFIGAIASLVPALGTSIVMIPAVAFLFLTGHPVAGFGLLIWGILAVGLVDNVLSVVFLKNKMKVHPLVVLFSILGGVEFFGAMGFLAGPVIAGAFVALAKIYPNVMLSLRKDKSPSG